MSATSPKGGAHNRERFSGKLAVNNVLLKTDYADVRIIGIPRALLFYRYRTFWTTFFENLGRRVVYSRETDQAILEAGTARSIDECCLASKAYLGHVESLLTTCDAVFVPCYASWNVRCGFCTKFQSLPDLVRNTFAQERYVKDGRLHAGIRILTCEVTDISDKKTVISAYTELAQRLGATPAQTKRAIKEALKAQEAEDAARANAQEEALRLITQLKRQARKSSKEGKPATEPPLTILFAAHPYIAHDHFLGGSVIDALERLDCQIIFADETRHERTFKESFEFSDTIPWVVNRELIGSIMLLQDHIDGIVLVSAFPCGPDSMTDDAIMRCIQGTPILNLLIDAQSGTAGIETRVESFIDILRFQRKGGYIHADA